MLGSESRTRRVVAVFSRVSVASVQLLSDRSGETWTVYVMSVFISVRVTVIWR